MAEVTEKRQYGKWDPENMKRALEDFRGRKEKLNEVCKKYEIPKKTFYRHLRNEVKRPLIVGNFQRRTINGACTVLPVEVENELVRYILEIKIVWTYH